MTLSIKQAMQVLANGEQLDAVAAAIITEENKITRLWVAVADAISQSPSPLATCTELEQSLRRHGYEKQALSNRCKAVAGHLQGKGLAVYWHRAGKAGPGAVAAFHSFPCPNEMKKAEQAEKAAALAAKKAELKALEAAAKEAEKAGQHEKQAAAMQVAATVRQAVETTEKENQAEKQAKAEKAQADAVADWMEVGIQLLIQGLIDATAWASMNEAAIARMLAAQAVTLAA